MLLAYSRMQQNAMTIQGPSYDSPMIFKPSSHGWGFLPGCWQKWTAQRTSLRPIPFPFAIFVFCRTPPWTKLHLVNTFILYDTPNHPNTARIFFTDYLCCYRPCQISKTMTAPVDRIRMIFQAGYGLWAVQRWGGRVAMKFPGKPKRNKRWSQSRDIFGELCDFKQSTSNLFLAPQLRLTSVSPKVMLFSILVVFFVVDMLGIVWLWGQAIPGRCTESGALLCEAGLTSPSWITWNPLPMGPMGSGR